MSRRTQRSRIAESSPRLFNPSGVNHRDLTGAGMSVPPTPTLYTSNRRHFGHLKESRLKPKDTGSFCDGASDIGQAPHCGQFTRTCSGDRRMLIQQGTRRGVPTIARALPKAASRPRPSVESKGLLPKFRLARSILSIASRTFHPMLTKESSEALTTYPCRSYIFKSWAWF